MSPPDLAGFGRCWSSMDLFGFGLRFGVYRFVPSDLQISSSAMVASLLRWSYGALARRLPDYGDGGVMIAARLRLASVLVVVARWSADLDVIFISCVRCTAMIEDE